MRDVRTVFGLLLFVAAAIAAFIVGEVPPMPDPHAVLAFVRADLAALISGMANALMFAIVIVFWRRVRRLRRPAPHAPHAPPAREIVTDAAAGTADEILRMVAARLDAGEPHPVLLDLLDRIRRGVLAHRALAGGANDVADLLDGIHEDLHVHLHGETPEPIDDEPGSAEAARAAVHAEAKGAADLLPGGGGSGGGAIYVTPRRRHDDPPSNPSTPAAPPSESL